MAYNRDLCSALTQMGLNPNRHLPEGEVAPMTIEFPGILPRIWVSVESKEYAKKRGIKQRVRAECPECRREFALGNLKQHLHGYGRQGRRTRACTGA